MILQVVGYPTFRFFLSFHQIGLCNCRLALKGRQICSFSGPGGGGGGRSGPPHAPGVKMGENLPCSIIYPLGNDHISNLVKRKTIDSKLPKWEGICDRSLEGTPSTCLCFGLVDVAQFSFQGAFNDANSSTIQCST